MKISYFSSLYSGLLIAEECRQAVVLCFDSYAEFASVHDYMPGALVLIELILS